MDLNKYFGNFYLYEIVQNTFWGPIRLLCITFNFNIFFSTHHTCRTRLEGSFFLIRCQNEFSIWVIFKIFPIKLNGTLCNGSPCSRGIVIDAGSSHTSFKLFQWQPALDLETRPIQLNLNYTCHEPFGMDDFSSEPDIIGDRFRPCLQELDNILRNVLEGNFGSNNIYTY